MCFYRLRRRMCNYCYRAVVACGLAPRKRIVAFFGMLIAAIFTLAIWHSANAQINREMELQSLLIEMREHIFLLESLYTARHDEVIRLKNRLKLNEPKKVTGTSTIPSELTMLVKNTTDTRESSGLRTSNLHLQTAFVYQLLPHLMEDPNSLRPAYHMKSNKDSINYVLGIPTVRRDKENYLMLTLDSLIKGLKDEEVAQTLIVVYVGDTELNYVLEVVREIGVKFRTAVDNGLIEVIAPPESYYPDISELTPNLGDSRKRFYWRTKQNLDTLFLMAYVRTKAPYYLMLEDDVIASKTYMQEIRHFTSTVSVTNPNWFFIEYCPIGGIGKLFRSSDLLHFITYVQLFYDKFPIDWLLDKYLMSRICTLDQTSKNCVSNKMQIRPKYKGSLFKHIGLYSSLKGKIHSSKAKDAKFVTVQTFYPHRNPPIAEAVATLKHYGDHTLMRAYKGLDFFWGIKPKKDDTITFRFQKPTFIERYMFRSGNPDYVSDKFLHAVVEVMHGAAKTFTEVGRFDEFGIAEGTIKKEFGPLNAIQLRVIKDHYFWAILSEIELVAVYTGNDTVYSADDSADIALQVSNDDDS